VKKGTPAVINHTENAIKVRKAGAAALGENNVFSRGAFMVSEDFSRYL